MSWTVLILLETRVQLCQLSVRILFQMCLWSQLLISFFCISCSVSFITCSKSHSESSLNWAWLSVSPSNRSMDSETDRVGLCKSRVSKSFNLIPQIWREKIKTVLFVVVAAGTEPQTLFDCCFQHTLQTLLILHQVTSVFGSSIRPANLEEMLWAPSLSKTFKISGHLITFLTAPH